MKYRALILLIHCLLIRSQFTCLHFIFNDKKELMHDNQLVKLAEIAKSIIYLSANSDRVVFVKTIFEYGNMHEKQHPDMFF